MLMDHIPSYGAVTQTETYIYFDGAFSDTLPASFKHVGPCWVW